MFLLGNAVVRYVTDRIGFLTWSVSENATSNSTFLDSSDFEFEMKVKN